MVNIATFNYLNDIVTNLLLTTDSDHDSVMKDGLSTFSYHEYNEPIDISNDIEGWLLKKLKM